MSHDEALPAWQECMTSKICEWLDENYGAGITAALTGTDWKAMRTVVALLELHAYAPAAGHWEALAIVVDSMQEKTRWYAWAIIAMVLNWDDRQRIWMRAGLPKVKPPCKAKHDDTRGDL